MQIKYLNHLPVEFKTSGIRLFYESLKEKIEPILGDYNRAQGVLEDGVALGSCFSAVCDEKVVGIMGIQSGQRSFLNPSFKKIAEEYGIFGGLFRMAGFALLHHNTAADELYVDGVAVADDMRGKGIGTQLFKMLEQKAIETKIRTISLDVIDTNPKAQALYERLGFVVVNEHEVWPGNLFFKFPFRSATSMTKTVVFKNTLL